jgi:hypothetical protein
MRWPWSKHEPDRVDRVIAEQKAQHEETLRRVSRVLSDATAEIQRTEDVASGSRRHS